MPDKANLSPREAFCFQLILDEGLLMGRLVKFNESNSHCAAQLIHAALPLIAMAENDMIPYLNRVEGFGLEHVNSQIASIRHMTKSLSSTHLSYGENARQADEIISQLRADFYSHAGPLDEIINCFRAEVGITYYDNLPLYTNYTVAHLLTKDDYGLLGQNGYDFCNKLGFDAGTSGAIALVFAYEMLGDGAV